MRLDKSLFLKKYGKYVWQCLAGDREMIRKNKTCNAIKDCDDGSDEMSCKCKLS